MARPLAAISSTISRRLARPTGSRRRCARCRRSAGSARRRAASRRSRCSRSRWRPSSRRRPSAASRGTGRSAGRVSSGGLRRRRRGDRGARTTSTQRPEPGALGDGVADEHLVVAVGEGRIGRAGGRTARPRRPRRRPGNGRAKVSPKPSTWPPGSAAAARPAGAHQGRVLDEDLVRPVAVAEPDLVGLLGVPGDRRASTRRSRTGASSSGPALIWRDADRAAGAVLEAEQDRRGVLGRDRRGSTVSVGDARSRTSRPGRSARGASR